MEIGLIYTTCSPPIGQDITPFPNSQLMVRIDGRECPMLTPTLIYTEASLNEYTF